MAPLSNMLGNIYGDGDGDDESGDDAVLGSDSGATDESAEREGAPEWADDDRLDDAFADWRAGEMPDDVDEDATAVVAGDSDTPSVRSVAVGELDTDATRRARPAEGELRDLGHGGEPGAGPADDGVERGAGDTVEDEAGPDERDEHAAGTGPALPWHRRADDLLPSKSPRGLRALLRR